MRILRAKSNGIEVTNNEQFFMLNRWLQPAVVSSSSLGMILHIPTAKAGGWGQQFARDDFCHTAGFSPLFGAAVCSG